MTDPIVDSAAVTAIRRKRLRFRCWHRGTREMDLLLGGFADRHVDSLQPAEFDALEALLERPDPEIYNWVTGHGPDPEGIARPLLARLRAHIETRIDKP